MSQNRRWINTRVEYQWNGTEYVEVSVEGYWYDGPMALAHNNPSIDQDTYAWYNDGTESGSTIIGTANNSQSLDADTTYLIRFLIQEQGGASSNNFSSQLEYDVNNSGTFNNVTSTSNSVRAVVSASLGTDGSNTTQRLGAGTFISANAGVDNGDGLAGTTSFAGNDEFEAVFAIQLRSADLTNGDTIQLRVAGCDVYTNTANATASVPNIINITLTGQNQAVTNGTLTVARNFKKSISTTGQNLAVTEGTLSISQTSATEITLTGEAVALSGGTIQVKVSPNVTLTGEALAVTGGSTLISLDRTITPTSDSMAVSGGTLAISTSLNTTITLAAQAVGIGEGSLSIDRNLRKSIGLTAEPLAVSGGSLTISAPINTTINLTGESVAVTAGALDIYASTTVTLTPDTLAINAGTLGVSSGPAVNTTVTLVSESVALTSNRLIIFDAGDTYTLTWRTESNAVRYHADSMTPIIRVESNNIEYRSE